MMRNKILIWIMIILYLTNAMKTELEIKDFIEQTNIAENLIRNKVYKVVDTDGKNYAMKKRRIIKGWADTEVFENEVNIMEKLKHKNILKLIDHANKDAFNYMLTEYCAGGKTLLDRLNETKNGYFPEKTAKEYFQQIMHGVLYMNEENIVHRNLALENIILETKDSNNIKIINFGMSYDCEEMKGGDPESIGSIPYMAPESFEKWNAENVCKEKTVDLWSLGVMLYKMLSGIYPYTISVKEALSNQPLKYNVWSFSHLIWNDVSDEAKDLVVQMLTLNPQERIKIPEILKHPWWKHTGNLEHISLNNGIEWISKKNINFDTMRIKKDITLKCGQKIRQRWKIRYYKEMNESPKEELDSEEKILKNLLKPGIYTFQPNKLFEKGDIVEPIKSFKTNADQDFKKGDIFHVIEFSSRKVTMMTKKDIRRIKIDDTYLPNFKIHTNNYCNPLNWIEKNNTNSCSIVETDDIDVQINDSEEYVNNGDLTTARSTDYWTFEKKNNLTINDELDDHDANIDSIVKIDDTPNKLKKFLRKLFFLSKNTIDLKIDDTDIEMNEKNVKNENLTTARSTFSLNLKKEKHFIINDEQLDNKIVDLK